MPASAAHAAADARRARAHASARAPARIPTVAAITQALTRVSKHVRRVRRDPERRRRVRRPTRFASRPQLNGGLLGGFQLAWDAIRGVPLRFAIYARGDSSPIIELKATDISYGPVASSVFDVSPPPGTRVEHISDADRRRTEHKASAARRAVARTLSFALDAPATAGGLSRTSVSRLGDDGAFVFYGHGLSGVAVIEQATHGTRQVTSSGGGGLSIPTVSINGTTAQQLQTALGTVASVHARRRSRTR